MLSVIACQFRRTYTYLVEMASPTNSNVCEFSPNHMLDNMLQAYEDEILREYQLINEVRYNLNKFYYVSTGFSAARGFLPVVKLANSKTCITFTKSEWLNFLDTQRSIIEDHTKKRHEVETEAIVRNVEMLRVIYTTDKRSQPIIKLERGHLEIKLDRTRVTKLVSLLEVVKNRLKRMNIMCFPEYYHSVLCTALRHSNGDTSTIEAYIRNWLLFSTNDSANNKWYSEYVDIFLEILVREREKFKRDIGSLVVGCV